MSSVDALAASIQALPWSAHSVALTALLLGLLLWGVGRRILKPMFCLFGGLAGAIGGFMVGGMTGVPTLGDVPTPFVGLGVGALLGMAVAASLYHFSVAVSFAIVAGLTGMLVSATWLELQDEAPSAVRAAIASQHEQLAARDAQRAAILSRPAPGAADRAPDRTLTDRARALAAALGSELASRWTTLDPRRRATVALATLASAGLGFFVGLLAPRRSAAAATALFGSAVWIGAGAWIAGALDMPGRELLDRGPREWLIIWLSVAGVGLALQLHGIASRRRPERA